jgi:hypothetical protein
VSPRLPGRPGQSHLRSQCPSVVALLPEEAAPGTRSVVTVLPRSRAVSTPRDGGAGHE